ncbi:DUF2332 domain-containing protein [Micromonospora sp. NPDC050417]|uniref:DUF2332 domain-containing protein n=1 Tax=Micromonospora sp. NPDC050417 TaxID=3364280 RepID=UPI0037A9A9C6
MTVSEEYALAEMFRRFARQEFRGVSPRYEYLSELLAERPDLSSPLLAAVPGQRRAILYFAAVQYLLRTTAAGHPLGAYLPTLGGDREPDEGLGAALTDLAGDHHAELTELCATRTTQTNEARRTAGLRTGFGRAAAYAQGRPLHLVELGTSAGLLLIADRYACRYVGPDGRTETYGPAEAAEALTMTVRLRGPGWPDPAAAELTIADRVGVDLSPIDASDPVATDWLRACIWPEQVERLTRLEAALAEVARVRPRLVAGDMVRTLPALLAEVDPGTVPVVFASMALTYLDRADRRRLATVLAEVGAERDLTVVLSEASVAGAELFLDGRPAAAAPPGVIGAALLTVVSWRGGRADVEVLGRTDGHGSWLEWNPTRYAYAPPPA